MKADECFCWFHTLRVCPEISDVSQTGKIQKERAMIIDAVCVRIMKSRKVESHTELMHAIVRQITMFNAQPVMIKKRIESLIEREYLERDKDQRNKYIYKP